MTTGRFAGPLAIVLAALALVATGCGSKSSSGSGLATALDYVPKGAPLVVAIDTNPDGQQFQQIDRLIGKFPFGGQVKQAINNSFTSRSKLDYDKDVKPLLGNDLVIASIGVGRPHSGNGLVAAWKLKDAGAGARLIQASAKKVGTLEGSDVYSPGSGAFAVIKDGTLVAAGSQAELDAALKRASGSDHMTEADFNARLGDLSKNALVRVGGDFQSLVTGPAAKVSWIAALRTFGATLSADPDGIGGALRVTTAGPLAGADLPLAAGAESAPVVRRAGEIGFGISNPAQIVAFAQTVAQLTDPAGYAKYQRNKAKTGKQLGIDIDRDVVGQLTGNASVSVSLDGGFAMRADLRDPAAAAATLKKAAPVLRKLAKGKSIGLSTPKGAQGFYGLAQANGRKVVFGVVGKTFVIATDASRAAQFAGQSPSIVPDAKGALVVASDARSLANVIAQRRGQGAAAQLLTAALGDLVGSVEAETTGLSGSFKLKIK